MTELAEQLILHAGEEIERALDDEINHIDQMNDDEIFELRRKRLNQLKEMQRRREVWIKKGHGQYRPVTDVKHFYELVEQSERLVVHFMRPSTPACTIIEKHLTAIASDHFETLFCYIDVERVLGIAEKFNVIMLPTLMLVEGKKTFHSIIGLDEFGSGMDFPTSKVIQVLGMYGMVNERGMFSSDSHED